MEQTHHGIDQLDSLQMLRIREQRTGFPEHFHDTFCISLIEKGLEGIRMGEKTLINEGGTISITNPSEIHANPILNPDISNGFTTLYLSPDLADYLLDTQGVHFQHQQESGPEIAHWFRQVGLGIARGEVELIVPNLQALLQQFRQSSRTALDAGKTSSRKWEELIELIDLQLEAKMSLEQLAGYMHLNKFSFAKEFRERYGLSPMNYVMMRKIFCAKSLITASTQLTELAYRFNFSDQAHFTRHFRRYVGVSPREYRKQCC